ncbi:hypothetical protein Aperf_G00000053535 [Anoplocephala perfoliata]
MDIERENIIAATRFATQEILDYVSHNKISVVEYDCSGQDSSILCKIVARLLCIIENGICHGLKSPESSSNSSPDPWSILQIVNLNEQFQNGHAVAFEDIKTGLGKARLWIQQSLMSKVLPIPCITLQKLGPNLLSMIENKDKTCIPTKMAQFCIGASPELCSCVNLYSKGSLLMTDSGIVFAGLLSGLEVIDFCFTIKDNLSLLDGPLLPIDYGHCIAFQSNVERPEDSLPRDGLEERLSSATEQKGCLIETLSTKQANLIKLTKKVTDLNEEIDALRTSKADLEAQITKLKGENERLANLLIRQSKEVQNEIGTIREKFRLSSLSLDSQNAELIRQIGEEKKNRIAAETALAQEKESTIAMEAEIARLKSLNSEREASLSEHRSQISAMMALNKEFSGKLRSVTSDLEATSKRADDLQEKVDGMSSVLEAVNERCHRLKEGKAAKEKALNEALERANEADRQCVQLQADLEANKESTQNLQTQLDEVYADVVSIKALQENLDRKSQGLRERDEMISDLQRRCAEAEHTLVEMSGVVEAAKLRAEDAEERVRNLSAAKWISDADVTVCSLCSAPFSFSRRKHHCRNCGLIFCQECSSFTMPLPSSAKPVRVCETCHNQLMQRYAMR